MAEPALRARVIRVEIASRADVLDGKAFGEAGTYERITGRVLIKQDRPLPAVELSKRFCELAIFYACLYVRVRRVDEPAE
jgi:hypothetical protein